MQMGSDCDALQKCDGSPASAMIRGERGWGKGRAAQPCRNLGEKRYEEVADGVAAPVP